MPIYEGGAGPTDEEGIPAKGDRRPPPPPGGGPGQGPGGGFSGFSGRRPQVFRGLSSLGDDLPILLRKRGMQVPGITPSTPGRSDTVPAMLQPGEKVIPQNVSQNPQYEPMLDQLIAQGRMGMGMAPGEAYGQSPVHMAGGGEVPDMPGARPSRAIRLLQLLLDLDEMDQGGTQHFAFGGTAQPNPFNMASPGGQFGNRFGAGAGIPRPQAPPAPAASPWSRDTEGNVTNFDAANPWANYQQNQNAFGLGLLYRGVGNAGAMGAFDPRGNQALINQQIEGAQGTKDALVRRQMTQADLSGLDPAQQAVAKLQALRETGRGVQDISAQVRAGAADRAQSFNEGMLRDLYTGGQQYSLNEQNARNERIAQQNAQHNANKFNPGAILGQVAGAALGGFTGGLGRGVPKTKIASFPPPNPPLPR
jgi:hypothetical protein